MARGQKLLWTFGVITVFAGTGIVLLGWQTNYTPAEPSELTEVQIESFSDRDNFTPEPQEEAASESERETAPEPDALPEPEAQNSEDLSGTDNEESLFNENEQEEQKDEEEQVVEDQSDNDYARINAEGGVPGGIQIDSIGLNSSVQSVGLDSEGYLDPPRNTVGWYTGSYKPNKRGPTVIAAHVSWARYGPDKFARLSEVVPGQEVQITDDRGQVFIYKVSNVYQINKANEATKFFRDVVYDPEAEHALWLVTCGGALSGGSFQDNIFVRAELVNVHTT